MKRLGLCRAAEAAGSALFLAFCGDPSANDPPSEPPLAEFTSSCTGTSCVFTDASSDPQGTIVTWRWDFGDGSHSYEVNPAHTYAQTGAYLVKLTIVDDRGASGSTARGVAAGSIALDFIGAGDIANCSSNTAATAALIAQFPTATVFTLGDNAYPDGSASDYRQCYDPTWGSFKVRTRPAPGNHDYHTSGAAGYFDYFGGNAGPPGRGYYSYDLGGWHIISLDSEIDATASSPQATWLVQDLAAHPATCTLAYWHKPLFTSGATHPPEAAMRPLFTILYDADVDVVLTGHNHHYERFAPQRPDGTRDDTRGIRQFVAGTGGAALYDFAAPQANSEVRLKTFGVLKLTLGATSYSWEFIPIAGSSFTDAGGGDCH
jgi:hypothetical protein